MISRKEFIRGAGIAATVGTAGVGLGDEAPRGRGFAGNGARFPQASFDGRHALRICSPLVREPVRIRFLADAHFGLADERDRDYADHYRRMAQCSGKKQDFEATLPRPESCDLLVLGGDIISFPTLANVDYVKGCLDACGVPYAYVAGNHDWHFEGDSGSDFAQRDRWIEKRLKPLYGGRDPLLSSVRVKGIKVILVDDSLYHITPEQLAAFRREVADGMPALVAMHIPLWQPGWDIFTSGNPKWGAATDPYWQIERRERWADHLMPSTFAFRDAVFSTPNVIGVLAGHIHRFMSSVEKGCPQWVVPDNRKKGYFDITVTGV